MIIGKRRKEMQVSLLHTTADKYRFVYTC